jgi:hypothetical protein
VEAGKKICFGVFAHWQSSVMFLKPEKYKFRWCTDKGSDPWYSFYTFCTCTCLPVIFPANALLSRIATVAVFHDTITTFRSRMRAFFFLPLGACNSSLLMKLYTLAHYKPKLLGEKWVCGDSAPVYILVKFFSCDCLQPWAAYLRGTCIYSVDSVL